MGVNIEDEVEPVGDFIDPNLLDMGNPDFRFTVG
jgi:hypothetical protein